jgi:hypothetical protein
MGIDSSQIIQVLDGLEIIYEKLTQSHSCGVKSILVSRQTSRKTFSL